MIRALVYHRVVSARFLALACFLVACGGPSAGPRGPAPVEPIAAESAPTPEPPPPTPPAVVDLHVDTVTQIIEKKVDWDSSLLEASLPSMTVGGVNVIVQAAWVPRGVQDPRGVALRKVHGILNMVRRSKGKAALVRGTGQLDAVLRSGRTAVVIALEGGTALVEDEKTLRELRDLGVSMIGLTWTESSPFADSSAEPRPGAAGGLTERGRAMVALCNELGLMIDVSHMSDKATRETVALSRAPVVASHSNARSVADVPRNLPDDLLTAIADKGGLVGAMFHGPFVVKGRLARLDDVAHQVATMVRLIGSEHVGLGSDWDGIIRSPEGLNRGAHMADLRAELALTLSPEQLEDVQGASFVRFWRAVEGAAGP